MPHRRFLAIALGSLLIGSAAFAAPSDELQNLKWFVVQGIGQGAGDLASYTTLIDDGMAEAQLLLQGDQGPSDVPCCVDIRRAAITQVALPTLQLVDNPTDYSDMTNICNQQGGGSCAFLVDSITYCGELTQPPGNPIGCADTPSCGSNNPTLVMVVSLESLATNATDRNRAFAQTIAHERGHNACLTHVTANPCQLMQQAAGGGCLDAGECGHYRDAGNAIGAACQCHTDSLTTVADGAACTEVASGTCSGGVCGAAGSDASVSLLAAGGLESVSGAATDDPLRMSGLSGGWTDLGSFSGATQVLGLEYAPGRDLVYGVTSADELITINPKTGAQLAVIGALPATGDFGTDGILPVRYDGLAFDPGATASLSDDRLYLVRQPESCDDQNFCSSQLVSVDPDTAATTLVGDLDTGFLDGVQGLAFDSQHGHLYASVTTGSASIWEIALDCPFQFCSVIDIAGRPRTRSSLAYDAATDRIYMVGTFAGDTLFYDVFDAATFEEAEPIGIDGFTPGGLAAPEPGAVMTGLAALASLSRLRRETLRRPRRAARRGC